MEQEIPRILKRAHNNEEVSMSGLNIGNIGGNMTVGGDVVAGDKIVGGDSRPRQVSPEAEDPGRVTESMAHAPEVFISYAWGGEREEIVNKLDAALRERGMTIIRDKRDLGYKGGIQDFMRRIGRDRYCAGHHQR